MLLSVFSFGKNEQVKKVFWALFAAVAGIVLARVVNPVTVQQIFWMITGVLW
jgi:hypothetical protein